MHRTKVVFCAVLPFALIPAVQSMGSDWLQPVGQWWQPAVWVDGVHNAASAPDRIILVQDVAPDQPFDDPGASQPFDDPGSSQPFDSGSSETPAPGRIGGFGASFVRQDQAANPDSEASQAASSAPGGTVVAAPTAALVGASSAGSLLSEAPTSTSVTVQRRSPVAYDPHIRGFRGGQIWSQANGQFWSPVRQDLDSMLGKIDPSLVEDIAVIPGPYGLRYGPGFGFIDVQLLRTPRYQCGYESHQSLGINGRDNRSRIFGRASVYGGSTDWGYRVHYGSRTGDPYRAGNGTLIPSSYNNQTFFGQFGFDLSSHSSIEIGYNRLDQTDTEYALQFFDIDDLVTDAFNVSFIDDDPGGRFSRIRLDGWYNKTRYNGDNRNSSKAPVVGRVRAAVTEDFGLTSGLPPGSPTVPQFADIGFDGITYGNRMLTGGRAVFTVGDTDWVHGRIGADLRYEDQKIDEEYAITYAPDPANPNFNAAFSTNQPKSWLIDSGVFAEAILPMKSFWKTTVGARLDFVHTDTRVSDLRSGGNLTLLPPDQLTQDDVLYAFYMINDLEINSHWTGRLGFGHSQRPPTLVERYSDGLFLGIIQSGFSRVVGNPNLKKERLWQIDLGLEAEYAYFRGRGNVYYSWVLDFATYQGNIITSPADARLLQSVNTDYATLAGFELYGEADLSPCWTVFSAMHYVQGTDQVIDVPLWGIAPLDARAGVRLHDPCGGRTWGIELAARMVDQQNRIGLIRNTGLPGSVISVEQATDGFMTVDLRSYYNYSENLSFVCGIENLLDRNYLEHLDLRLPAQQAAGTVGQTNLTGLGVPDYAPIAALSPGMTFYLGFELKR